MVRVKSLSLLVATSRDVVGGCHGLMITRRPLHLAPVIPSMPIGQVRKSPIISLTRQGNRGGTRTCKARVIAISIEVRRVGADNGHPLARGRYPERSRLFS